MSTPEAEFIAERDAWHRGETELEHVGAELAGRSADGIPVGLQEIAELLGVTRSTVDAWRSRGVLPTPEWTVGGRPAWSLGSIERWARQSGRLPEVTP